ncbi:hypothetical protein [Fusibacter sp. 3D3]|uniref:hypothetical protein n=1 Tax=Fusibacter sp. 3D3 TaxID=1048380 RepID=UPI000852E538|nr:hypothetical protein [Fusibacter sp. 3D3]GAU75502.1 hypothetical protein F3D3_0093 [Fusibacter sp. 3D3]
MSQKSYLSTKSKVQLIIILFVVIGTFFYLGSNRPNSAGTVIAASDLIDHADEQAKANVENVVATMKAEFDKEYSDPSLYFEDFSEEIAVLDVACNKSLEAYFSDKIEIPYFTKSYNQYYLPTLKKFRDGEISVSEVADDPAEYIRVLKFDIYTMVSENYNGETGNQLLDYVSYLEENGVKHFMYQEIQLKTSEITEIELSKLRHFDNPFEKIKDKNVIKRRNFMSDLGSNSTRWDKEDERVKQLEKKYNVALVKADLDYSLKERSCTYYAPENDPTMKFPATEIESRCIQIYAQRALYEEIEKIVDEEGYGGKIVHIAIPRNRDVVIYDENGRGRDPDVFDFDLSLNPDNMSIINEGYKGCYDITLNLLLEEGEEIDYEKLQKITARITDLLKMNYVEGDEPWERERLFVFFYVLPEAEQKIVIDLFQRDMITETYFRERTTLSNIYSDMYYVREETEGFHYLDTRAKKKDFLLWVTGDYKSIINATVESFFEKAKQNKLIE